MSSWTAVQFLQNWADAAKTSPLQTAGALNATQKSLSSLELRGKPPVIIRDSQFLDKLKEHYAPLLNLTLSTDVNQDSTTLLNRSLWGVALVQSSIMTWPPLLETEESVTNRYHERMLVPIIQLAWALMAKGASALGRMGEGPCDDHFLHPRYAGEIAHREGKNFIKADHTIVGDSPSESRPNAPSLMCIEDKNTYLGQVKWRSVDNYVVTNTRGMSEEEKVWRQVHTQLKVAGCVFGKLTAIYEGTWYYWKPSHDSHFLYVSKAHVFPERGNAEVYYSHFLNTLLLLVAAIHQKSPEALGDQLKPLTLKPPVSVASRALKNFHIAGPFWILQVKLALWTWISWFQVKLFGMGAVKRSRVIYSGPGILLERATSSLLSERWPLSLPLYIRLGTFAGVGAIGTVYRNRDLSLVFKVGHQDARESIIHEAATYESLMSAPDAPVPRFYGHFRNAKENLELLILEDCGDPLAVETLEELGGDYKAALREALLNLHRRGIHHHDIKPENVLVKNDGSLCLIDFHTAVRLCNEGLYCPDTQLLQMLQTPFEL